MSGHAVAAAAEVNLGSFAHPIGTRDTFVYELGERWHATMFADLQLSATGPDSLGAVVLRWHAVGPRTDASRRPQGDVAWCAYVSVTACRQVRALPPPSAAGREFRFAGRVDIGR